MMSDLTDQPIRFDEVADFYDAYVQADFDIPFWLSETKTIKGNILELACGTGRVSIPLLNAGIELTCVDYAPGMLDVFRRKLKECNLACRLVCQDIAELSIPQRFDLIFLPFHSFSEIISESKQRAGLQAIRAHLTSDGRFICTLQNPTIRAASMDGSVRLVGEFPMRDGENLIVKSKLTFDSSTGLASGEQLYDRLGADGRLIEHRSLEMNFHLFTRLQFEALALEAGFEIINLFGDYSSAEFEEESSPYMIWKLRRR